MKKESTLLTIGMIIYNEEKYIVEAIESLLSQTYKNFKLFISDNASTDKTSEICRKYATKDKRITYFRHKTNTGGYFSFKYVLDKVDTKFFMFCAGHDKWDLKFIEKLLPVIQREKLVLVYPKVREIKIDGTMGEVYSEDYTTTKIEKPTKRYLYVLKNMGMCNAIYGIWDTKIIKDCYVKKPIIAGDVLMILKATFFGKFKQYKEVLFLRRMIRKEKNQYSRQIRYAATKKEKKNIKNTSLKKDFIIENVKILYRDDFKMGFFPKLFLSLATIWIWIRRLYIRLFFIAILKNILPGEMYIALENRLKIFKKYL